MDIKTLEEKLLMLNGEIKSILLMLGYKRQYKLNEVIYDKDNMDECMLYREFCNISSHLGYVYSVLNYLQKPVTQEGIMHLNDDGVYEINGCLLKCDDA